MPTTPPETAEDSRLLVAGRESFPRFNPVSRRRWSTEESKKILVPNKSEVGKAADNTAFEKAEVWGLPPLVFAIFGSAESLMAFAASREPALVSNPVTTDATVACWRKNKEGSDWADAVDVDQAIGEFRKGDADDELVANACLLFLLLSNWRKTYSPRPAQNPAASIACSTGSRATVRKQSPASSFLIPDDVWLAALLATSE